jgi:hypothetical protein
MIPTPIESRDMAEELLEEEPVTEETAAEGWDCGQLKCYKYRRCFACVEWLGCNKLPLGTCFKCDMRNCPLPNECAECMVPEVE